MKVLFNKGLVTALTSANFNIVGLNEVDSMIFEVEFIASISNSDPLINPSSFHYYQVQNVNTGEIISKQFQPGYERLRYMFIGITSKTPKNSVYVAWDINSNCPTNGGGSYKVKFFFCEYGANLILSWTTKC
jgi:hypothetical protein